MKTITIIGLGYVGLSLSCLLSKRNKVIGLDVDKTKIFNINQRNKVFDDDINNSFDSELNLIATESKDLALKDSELVIIAIPTNYDNNLNSFDTTQLEKLIEEIININSNALIVIKSTIPIGFTDKICKKLNTDRVIFSPEFLREGSALKDNLYPSRIIVGSSSEKAKSFGCLMKDEALKKDVDLIYMSSKEAESVKLFSNTYLAMRVSYFNELDTFCETNGLDTSNIIKGVSSDDRVGNFYNNPSFGYGGYCLPKDSKQLLRDYEDIPNELIKAIVKSNSTRKKYIAKQILNKSANIIGIYRLIMKKGSNNFRSSSIIDIINLLISHKKELVIFEPMLDKDEYKGIRIVNDLDKFKTTSDLIITNRLEQDLLDVKSKVYTRDIFDAD
jgi:UDPglucose 6-dehydrogenase